uniref:Uncharacterized protein n=1 Tax=Solanum lycopersicum TaxID=4081 RepID=A0A3Q7J0L9_SOLLC
MFGTQLVVRVLIFSLWLLVLSNSQLLDMFSSIKKYYEDKKVLLFLSVVHCRNYCCTNILVCKLLIEFKQVNQSYYILCFALQISEMEVGLAVGGAFLSSGLQVIFDRLAPKGDLLKMFQKHKKDVRLLKKLRMTLLGLQAVLSDAENKQASNQFVREWLNELRDAVDGAENLIEQVNYEALRLEAEGKHQNLGETSNQQVSELNLCLSDDFFLNIKNKLEYTIETLKDLQEQIGDLGLKEHFGSTKQETRTPSTSLVDDSDIFGRQNDIEELIDRLLSEDASGKKLTVVPIVGMDYQFCKDQIIHLWIANGLVQQLLSGNQYFLELRSRSLFERVPESSEWNSEKFLMHDLVNDLSQIASSNLCIRLEEKKGLHMLEQCRHMSCLIGEDGDFEKLKSLFKSEQLRTLLPINIQPYYNNNNLSKRVQLNILPRLRSLRVLSLSHYSIKELSNDLFIKLKLLRFLDISHTKFKRLPDSICVLYNLETLLLSSCADIEELPLQMEKLINLHYLDISNTPRLKMPLHLSKLKSLQVLVGAKFLLGGSRMEDLGEVHNLYGSLSVLELQHVVDIREVLKAKMREKNHVDKLSLEWSGSSSADNAQTERDILEELRPHKNIKEVEIIGYRGTNFPDWVADPLFVKLVKLSLRNCKNCYSLPALGQLPCLKFLWIRGMHGITEVTEEFYGSLSPFNSLVELRFEDMPEWKQWHLPGRGEFPTLEKLLVKNCPELSLETPIQLSSLKRFNVIGCPKVGVVFDEGMKQIEEFYIRDCNSLPFSILPSSLKVVECDCIDDISAELLPTARNLSIRNCHNLTRLSIPTATESLYIQKCEKLSMACGGTQMTYLCIRDCKKLNWLPELLPSLKTLELINCPEIESFPRGRLQQLVIWNCKKLVNRRKEWRLQTLPCLRELLISHDGSDEDIEHWELPCSITRLEVSNLKTLSSQHLKSLTSLQYLCIEGNLPQIQSMLEQGHFSHLTSLQTLLIMNFRNLQSLPQSALPSSLSQLTIYDCSNLQSLPLKGMPSSLSKLSISKCPLLTPLLEFEKGEYWTEIAQIPRLFNKCKLFFPLFTFPLRSQFLFIYTYVRLFYGFDVQIALVIMKFPSNYIKENVDGINIDIDHRRELRPEV